MEEEGVMGLWRQRREGGGHQPRDGRLEPPEAGRGGKDPPLETLEGAQPWDPLTSDVWSPGLGDDGWLVVRTGRGWIPKVLSQSMRRLH